MKILKIRIIRTFKNLNHLHLINGQREVISNHSHQSDHLARLANNFKVLQPLEDEGDVEGADRHKVNYVHCISYEPKTLKNGIQMVDVCKVKAGIWNNINFWYIL